MKQSLTKRGFMSAYMPTNFGTLTVNAWVPVNNLWSKIVDPANNFTTTNGQYKPKVAGWYQINAGLTISGSAGILAVTEIYKNGTTHRRIGSTVLNAAGLIGSTPAAGCAVYFNGTTDYIDLRVFTDMTGANVLGDANGEYSWFQAYLIEAD